MVIPGPSCIAAIDKHSDEGGREKIIRLLINGSNLESKTNSGYTALIKASLAGHLDIVELLLEKGVEVDAATFNGITALMGSAQARIRFHLLVMFDVQVFLRHRNLVCS